MGRIEEEARAAERIESERVLRQAVVRGVGADPPSLEWGGGGTLILAILGKLQPCTQGLTPHLTFPRQIDAEAEVSARQAECVRLTTRPEPKKRAIPPPPVAPAAVDALIEEIDLADDMEDDADVSLTAAPSGRAALIASGGESGRGLNSSGVIRRGKRRIVDDDDDDDEEGDGATEKGTGPAAASAAAAPNTGPSDSVDPMLEDVDGAEEGADEKEAGGPRAAKRSRRRSVVVEDEDEEEVYGGEGTESATAAAVNDDATATAAGGVAIPETRFLAAAAAATAVVAASPLPLLKTEEAAAGTVVKEEEVAAEELEEAVTTDDSHENDDHCAKCRGEDHPEKVRKVEGLGRKGGEGGL